MALAPPPYSDAFAIVEDQRDQKNWPKLIPGFKWLRWLTDEMVPAIDRAPTRQAHASHADQAASLPLTPLPLAQVPPGLYRVSYWFRVTTPGGVSSSLQFSLTWTSGGVVLTSSGVAVTTNTTSSLQFGTLIVRVDADAPISYATTYASAGVPSMVYELDVVAEALSLDQVG